MAERLFGTNGVRGIINEDMTSEMVLQLGKAIGTVMNGMVAVASDTRTSADMLKMAISAGIMAVGRNVLDLGVLPTPALQYYVRTRSDIKGGVMITASHNPPMFNGIKCISYDGTEATRKEEEAIEEQFSKEIPGAAWNYTGEMERVWGAGEEYVDAIVSKVDADAIRKAELRVCLDCANGAAYETSPLLLKKLNVKAITLNCNPQGESPGRPIEPTEDNIKDVLSLTRATRSDLGIAHDGDADRCVFITSDGKFVGGDKSLALLSKYTLSKQKGLIVTPVSTSSLVAEVVEAAGGTIIFTAVGSPIVARKMMETGAIFGGEENGGLIFPEQQFCRDGGMAIAKMLECVAKAGPLKNQVSKLPIYYTVKKKIDCPNDMKKHVLEYIENESAGAMIDKVDGMKATYDDGWVLARPSGTEPAFRIFSESKDEVVANQRAEKYETMVKEYLNMWFK
ncbi:putative phosphoglucosamine mutase [Candidatus Methanoplasma termitum]|uniref:GlmM2 protein n=1 Tax=Candidatus Methanoplasma termitum TaxID=1577791 RepID=A0A0A7LCU4_9ARCH|nr:phosphoglucosamine mutase [Candidatus Methanoplasma termitum]AIZ56990.1 putative phosphoglucosamine mutase [Candidatus Methanoplasma termitum]MCL2334113.1 phosphoglucosamine mutase [Candidatus Methanoplasma sp.]